MKFMFFLSSGLLPHPDFIAEGIWPRIVSCCRSKADPVSRQWGSRRRIQTTLVPNSFTASQAASCPGREPPTPSPGRNSPRPGGCLPFLQFVDILVFCRPVLVENLAIVISIFRTRIRPNLLVSQSSIKALTDYKPDCTGSGSHSK